MVRAPWLTTASGVFSYRHGAILMSCEGLDAKPRVGKVESKSMATTDRIEVNPRVMLGKPVIRRTRIPVELILRKLSGGATETDLLDAYPRITRQDIHAAIRYAADAVAHEETVFVRPKRRARR